MQLIAADWVAHHARTRAAQIALRNLESGESRTWEALESRVGRLAHALLHELGLGKGDRVATLTHGNLRSFELQFACMRAGLVLAPLNFRLAVPELVAACEEVSPRLMITDENWSTAAREVAAKAGLDRVISWLSDESEFDSLARGPRHMPERLDVPPDEPALILFTSGTTGKSKCAVVTHGALVWQAINQVQFARVAEQDAHVLSPLPLFHAGGLNSLSTPILFFGGQVTVCARFDAEASIRFVGDPANGVTHLSLVPLMYQLMAEAPAFRSADLRKLHTALVAGGRLTDKLRETYAAKGVSFTTQYGATETGPTVTALDPRRVDKAKAGSCGQKALFCQIRLVTSTGDEAAPGEPGEVWVKGPAIIRGYLNRDPTLDFTAGWFRTGDVARVDDEGFYYIVDRMKDMYKSGGENVYPAEVEKILLEHPDILDVAVIGVAHERWGEVGLAAVVAVPERDVTLASLRSFCEGRLARYKQPQHIAVVDALPRNVTGKVAKDQLRRQFGAPRTA